MRQITFHNAGPQDHETVARLHVQSWRKTYAHFYPPSFLQHKATQERLSHWKNVLEQEAPEDIVILAYDEADEPLGFASLKVNADAEADATLDCLHLETNKRGLGIGRLLMKECARQLDVRELSSMCLWVYDDNAPAIRFYERLDGTVTSAGFEDIYGGRFAHTQYSWHDLPALIEKCAQ
ncbi:MAG: GNAT family N-acetyltransferase [Hyphomicrobiales bacterium]